MTLLILPTEDPLIAETALFFARLNPAYGEVEVKEDAPCATSLD